MHPPFKKSGYGPDIRNIVHVTCMLQLKPCIYLGTRHVQAPFIYTYACSMPVPMDLMFSGICIFHMKCMHAILHNNTNGDENHLSLRESHKISLKTKHGAGAPNYNSLSNSM